MSDLAHGEMHSALSAKRVFQHYVPGINLNMDISLERLMLN